MAKICLNEKQYELLKNLMLKEDEGQELTLDNNGEKYLMQLKDALDSFHTALFMGHFDNEHDIGEMPEKSIFREVWEQYLEPAYKILSKYMYNSNSYQETHI